MCFRRSESERWVWGGKGKWGVREVGKREKAEILREKERVRGGLEGFLRVWLRRRGDHGNRWDLVVISD